MFTRGISSRIPQAIGVFLLIAAALKLQALFLDPTRELLSAHPIWLTVLSAQFELVVGLLLIILPNSVFILRAGAVFFAILFAVALQSLISGAKDCGCLGNVKTHPLVFVIVDMASAGALLGRAFGLRSRVFAKDKRDDFAELPVNTESGNFYAVVRGALIGLVTVVFMGWILYSLSDGFRQQVLAIVRSPVELVPSKLEFGKACVGDIRQLQFTFVNHTSKPVTIIGGRASCTCTILPVLPITVGSNDSAAIPIRLKFEERHVGNFHKSVVLYCDESMQVALVGAVYGVVEPARKSEPTVAIDARR